MKIPIIHSFKSLRLYGVLTVSLFTFSCGSDTSTTVTATPVTQYTVSFDANGGTGVPSSVSVVAGSKFTVPTTLPTRASTTTVGGTTTTYYFGGWYTGQQDTDQHGRTKHKASTPVTNDLTLYARWYTKQPADKAALVAIITNATADADLNHIDVRQVIDLANLFQYNTNFNGAISRWDVSEVINMKNMFGGQRGSAFNGELNNWDTGNVRDMSYMFLKASFNQDIGGWNTGNVRDMSSMFWGTTVFNKDIGEWNTGNVRDMRGMFQYASSFNQDLTKWLNTANPSTTDMFFGTDMTAANKACWMPAPVPSNC